MYRVLRRFLFDLFRYRSIKTKINIFFRALSTKQPTFILALDFKLKVSGDLSVLTAPDGSDVASRMAEGELRSVSEKNSTDS